MFSTFHGLETSKRALFTQRVALNTMGHNIANAATEGYSRQRVNMTATRPMDAPAFARSNAPGQIGTGVEYSSVVRLRDNYLDMQFRRENQSMGEWGVRDATMRSLEKIINEPSESGLRAVMDEFWNSWEVLNRDPQLLSARVDVVGTAVNLVDTLKHIDTSLNTLAADLDNNIGRKVTEANNIIENIAILNGLIRKTEGLGNNANDYRDKRDLLIDQLSTLVDVEVTETPDGILSITSAGVQVVNHEAVVPLAAANAAGATAGELAGYEASKAEVETLRQQLNAMVNTLMTGTVEVQVQNGYVASKDMVALVDVRLENGTVIPAGETIPEGSRIEAADPAQSFIRLEVNGFNGLHQLGYGLSNPPSGNRSFFTTTDGSATFTIANIQVNPDIQKNTDLIAASGKYDIVGTDAQVIRGNSDIAHAIAGLRDKVFTYPQNVTSLSQGTTDDYFRALTGDLGIRAANTTRNYNNQRDLVDAINMRRQEVSGVSLDEEMSDMIRFQHAYNAAARNMTAVDEMLDRIINGMGIVGR
ncbi:flagellar hook-associated protein 1 [Xylanibacillus composti]|uniref:Flagellar hook-associated protein 1 n=1 Tax=Xylanibacillus composti TaxID=1572762 RepID=A0A8J4M3F3_9BACL|nr:flagellar hook-associated protein 1 [Xylanibacillus composti]